jgi:hypothetical protein
MVAGSYLVRSVAPILMEGRRKIGFGKGTLILKMKQ